MSEEMIRVEDPMFARTSVPGVVASARHLESVIGVLFARKEAIDGRTRQPVFMNFVLPFCRSAQLPTAGYEHADIIVWLKEPSKLDRIYAACLLAEGIEVRAWD